MLSDRHTKYYSTPHENAQTNYANRMKTKQKQKKNGRIKKTMKNINQRK